MSRKKAPEVHTYGTLKSIGGSAALICGALPACAAGLGWKVLSYQSVKEPEILLSRFRKCLSRERTP
jgi:hypothetical protein